MLDLAKELRLALAEQAVEEGDAGRALYWFERARRGDASEQPRPQRRAAVEGIFDSAAAFDNLVSLLTEFDCRPHVASNGQGSAVCPAHDDNGPSLRFKDDGRLLIYCGASCSPDEVLEALHVTWSALGGLGAPQRGAGGLL